MSTLRQTPFKPLVVGAPRTGFTLLSSVLIHFVPYAVSKTDRGQALANHFIDKLEFFVSERIVRALEREGISSDLVYNRNFRSMLGGPKWLHPDDDERACFRKYIGVRGMGDISLNTSHPRRVLDRYEVVHSHVDAPRWLAHPRYADYAKFASVRNPVGTLNSSVFSINALTSEYIQKFLPPDEDNHAMRERLALYKLTDFDFFRGLISNLRRNIEEFLTVADGFCIMRWEDLIQRPVPTIQALGRAAGFDVDESFASETWAKLDHVNLTGAHKHNLRRGGGVVGDWRNWLTNHHLALIEGEGLFPLIEALGYPLPEPIHEDRYTPYQRRLEELIRAGEVFDDYPDQDLFGFAFNKSNLDSEKFPFRRYDWREHTRIERSCFADERIERIVSDVAEEACAELNEFITEVYAVGDDPAADVRKGLLAVAVRHPAVFHGSSESEPTSEPGSAAETAPPAEAATERTSQVGWRLEFVEATPDSFADAIGALLRGGHRCLRLFSLESLGERALIELLQDAPPEALETRFFAPERDIPARLRGIVAPLDPDTATDATVHFETDAEALSFSLMAHLDASPQTVLAPKTKHFFENRPLFLISIPKAGTHLLYSLAEVFGYHRGIVCPETPKGGHWYCVEYSNSHTAAPDFFIDTVRRAPLGNRDHPFMASPAVFIYRNPLDVLVSEAHYYHQDGNTTFAGYLAHLSLRERILRLIDDPWLLGTIRERIGKFVAWTEFGNVIPVSFEELVGARGGGKDAARERLIWALQLKLHVPGRPMDFAEAAFDTRSPTFRSGQIGAWRETLDDGCLARFLELPQDFMEALGFGRAIADPRALLSDRAEEFLRRPLTTSSARFDDTPVAVELNYLGHAIVRYRGRYYGLAHETGETDLASVPDEELAELPSAETRPEIEHLIAREVGTKRRTV